MKEGLEVETPRNWMVPSARTPVDRGFFVTIRSGNDGDRERIYVFGK